MSNGIVIYYLLLIDITISVQFQIDWCDPLLIFIIITHVAIITVVATTRKHSLFQMILFIGMRKYFAVKIQMKTKNQFIGCYSVT